MFLSSHEYKDCFSNSLSEVYGGKQSDKSWKKCEHLLFLGRKKIRVVFDVCVKARLLMLSKFSKTTSPAQLEIHLDVLLLR